MKATTLKKYLAVLVGSALLVCALTGCNSDTAHKTDPINQNTTDLTPAGMIMLRAKAAVKITYDADGMVLRRSC